MPITHDIDTTRRLITISGEGDYVDARASASELFELPGHDDYSILFLVEHSWTPDADQLTMLRHWMGLIRDKFAGRIAIAASGVGQLTPALVLTLTVDDGSERLRAFTTEEEARFWLAGASGA